MKIRPEHFDWLGFGAFIYILVYSLFVLLKGEATPNWATYGLALIAIAGAIVDGVIVYRFFLRKKN